MVVLVLVPAPLALILPLETMEHANGVQIRNLAFNVSLHNDNFETRGKGSEFRTRDAVKKTKISHNQV